MAFKLSIMEMFSYFLINNAPLYHFLANWLAHNKKMTEKSVFREAWSPELTSQSFPVPCFWSRGFVPLRKWNLTLLAHQNTGKENRYRKNCFATLISALGRFNRANKKKSVIYTLKLLSLTKDYLLGLDQVRQGFPLCPRPCGEGWGGNLI